MVFDFFKRKPKGSYSLLFRGKELTYANPLHVLAPALYEGQPEDKYAGLEALEADAEERIAEALHVMRLPQQKTRALYLRNCMEILRIPALYTLAKTLQARGLDRFLENSHVLATYVQACAFYGRSEFLQRLQQNLMPLLLGIYARYYGVQFMKEDEFASLLQTRRFNIKDPKEQALRDEFLKCFKAAAERLTSVSSSRFLQVLGADYKGHDSLRAVMHIIRYSTRLMGRTALDISLDAEQDIHQLAAYVGVLYSVASAQMSTGKRLCLILAEEYARNRVYHKHEGMERSARYNIYAIQDLMAATRCHLLEFFQGKEAFAIYSEAERVYVKQVAIDGEPGHWSCFRSETTTPSMAEREKSGRTIEANVKLDPPDDDLIPVENMIDTGR